MISIWIKLNSRCIILSKNLSESASFEFEVIDWIICPWSLGGARTLIYFGLTPSSIWWFVQFVLLFSCKKLFGCKRYWLVPQISWQRTRQRSHRYILSPIVSIYNISAFVCVFYAPFRPMMLQLLGQILYQNFYSLLNDGYAEFVYYDRHCSSFPGHLSHISTRKWYTKSVYKTNFTQKGTTIFRPLQNSPRRRVGMIVLWILHSLWIEVSVLEIQNYICNSWNLFFSSLFYLKLMHSRVE